MHNRGWRLWQRLHGYWHKVRWLNFPGWAVDMKQERWPLYYEQLIWWKAAAKTIRTSNSKVRRLEGGSKNLFSNQLMQLSIDAQFCNKMLQLMSNWLRLHCRYALSCSPPHPRIDVRRYCSRYIASCRDLGGTLVAALCWSWVFNLEWCAPHAPKQLISWSLLGCL